MCLGIDVSDSEWRCILGMYFFGRSILTTCGLKVSVSSRRNVVSNGVVSSVRREFSPSSVQSRVRREFSRREFSRREFGRFPGRGGQAAE